MAEPEAGPSRPRKKRRLEGAPSPQEVARAVTFKGASIAWAILKRHKVVENRPFRLPAGGWIAIHVGKGAWTGDYSKIVPGIPPEADLLRDWQGTIVGCLKVKDCRRPSNCGPFESSWAKGPVCNVIEAVVELPEPVPVPKGKLGLWEMGEVVKAAVRARLADARPLATNLDGLPPLAPIVGPITPGRYKRREPERSAAGGPLAETDAAERPLPAAEPVVQRCPTAVR